MELQTKIIVDGFKEELSKGVNFCTQQTKKERDTPVHKQDRVFLDLSLKNKIRSHNFMSVIIMIDVALSETVENVQNIPRGLYKISPITTQSTKFANSINRQIEQSINYYISRELAGELSEFNRKESINSLLDAKQILSTIVSNTVS